MGWVGGLIYWHCVLPPTTSLWRTVPPSSPSWSLHHPDYCRPFRVLHRYAKMFQVDVSGVPQWLSINRLKAAHVCPDSQQCVVTCSGQVSHAPFYFQGLWVAVGTHSQVNSALFFLMTLRGHSFILKCIALVMSISVTWFSMLLL